MASGERLQSRSTPRPGGELSVFVRRALAVALFVAVLLVLGTVGFMLTEGVGVWYAFRFTLDTVSTLGGPREPASTEGQVVQVALIVLGVGTIFYALATLVEFFVAGHLGELLAARRMQTTIDALSDHHIVCGFGRVGRQVARDLRAAGAGCVIVDSAPASAALAQQLGMYCVEGDAADEAVLLRAGIERARSIIVCADSDSDNVFITLTARELRGDVAIVARAAAEDSEKKLKRAGADRVISPYKSSGTEMARLALHPQLSGVVDVDVEYRMEEIPVEEASQAVGQTVGDIRGGSMIVGLRGTSGFHPQPAAEIVLRPGDVVVAMGTPAALERLERLMAGHPASVSGGRHEHRG